MWAGKGEENGNIIIGRDRALRTQVAPKKNFAPKILATALIKRRTATPACPRPHGNERKILRQLSSTLILTSWTAAYQPLVTYLWTDLMCRWAQYHYNAYLKHVLSQILSSEDWTCLHAFLATENLVHITHNVYISGQK